MTEEKKKCPCCKCMKPITDFHGLRKPITRKCIRCNKLCVKYVNNKTAEKQEDKKKEIIEKFLLLNGINKEDVKFN